MSDKEIGLLFHGFSWIQSDLTCWVIQSCSQVCLAEAARGEEKVKHCGSLLGQLWPLLFMSTE